jgi:hypothetical protein
MAFLSTESALMRTGLLEMVTLVVTIGGRYGSSRTFSGTKALNPLLPPNRISPFWP